MSNKLVKNAGALESADGKPNQVIPAKAKRIQHRTSDQAKSRSTQKQKLDPEAWGNRQAKQEVA